MRSQLLKQLAAPSGPFVTPARAARMPAFVGLQGDLHAVLDRLEIVIFGVGAVGLNLALHAARLLPKSITLVDPGVFEPENMLTQAITPAAIGRGKAEYAGELCQQISPRTTIKVFQGRLQDVSPSALASAQIILLASDNLAAEVEATQLAMHLGLPLIQASLMAEMLVAQVRFVGNRAGESPCLACGFGTAEISHLQRETVFSCRGSYLGEVPAKQDNRAETRSVSFHCSLVADLAMTQMVRHLGGLGKSVEDTVLEYCGYTHRTIISPLRRNDECPCDHQVWTRRRLSQPASQSTPRELVRLALGEQAEMQGISLAVDQEYFAEAGICGSCGTNQPINRFVSNLRAAFACCACGQPVAAVPFFAHRPVPLAALSEVLDTPLGLLIDGEPETIVVRGPGEAVLLELCESEAIALNS